MKVLRKKNRQKLNQEALGFDKQPQLDSITEQEDLENINLTEHNQPKNEDLGEEDYSKSLEELNEQSLEELLQAENIEFQGLRFDSDGNFTAQDERALGTKRFLDFLCMIQEYGLLDQKNTESSIMYADDQYVNR